MPSNYWCLVFLLFLMPSVSAEENRKLILSQIQAKELLPDDSWIVESKMICDDFDAAVVTEKEKDFIVSMTPLKKSGAVGAAYWFLESTAYESVRITGTLWKDEETAEGLFKKKYLVDGWEQDWNDRSKGISSWS